MLICKKFRNPSPTQVESQ